MSDDTKRLSFSGRTLASKPRGGSSILSGRAMTALSGVAWLAVLSLWWLVAGLGVGLLGVVYENWYLVGFAAVCELAAANLTFLSLREDR